MKIKNRILAGVSAAIMAVGAASMLPVSYLSASAIQIPAYNETTGKISKFEYTVKVEKISSTRVKVAFQILNNPGYESLSIAIKSDAKYISDNCDKGVTKYNESTKTAFLAIASPNTVKVRSTWEFIYDISANPNKSYDFGVAVVDYKSAAENIKLKHEGIEYDATLNALKKGVTIESNNKTVLIGDADNDGYITIQDASLILDVVSKCEKNGIEFIRTEILNKYLKSNYDNWRTEFPNLVCAEAIDVDTDYKITEDDANKVLDYYSKVYAGSHIVDSLIGTKQAVTVVYSN